MSRQAEIQAAIRQFLEQQFPTVRKSSLADTDSLLEQGIIDSMGVLEIVTFIEGQFEVTLTDDELMSDHFDSIAAMAQLVHNKTSEGSPWIS